MKGVNQFLIKSIYLILVIIVIAIVINRIIAINSSESEQKSNLKFNYKASEILETLAGYSNCLAYDEKGKINNKEISTSTQKILDKNKLDVFQINFNDTEPICFMDPEYNYKVQIDTFPISISSFLDGPAKQTVSYQIDAQHWNFGTANFSLDKAFDKSISITVPILVYYGTSTFIPGNMKITLVSGEMEKVSSFIDQSCFTEKKLTKNIHLTYPTRLELINQKNYVCMKFESGEKCQRLSCQKQIEFNEIKSAGNYIFISANTDDLLKIIV